MKTPNTPKRTSPTAQPATQTAWGNGSPMPHAGDARAPQAQRCGVSDTWAANNPFSYKLSAHEIPTMAPVAAPRWTSKHASAFAPRHASAFAPRHTSAFAPKRSSMWALKWTPAEATVINDRLYRFVKKAAAVFIAAVIAFSTLACALFASAASRL